VFNQSFTIKKEETLAVTLE